MQLVSLQHILWQNNSTTGNIAVKRVIHQQQNYIICNICSKYSQNTNYALQNLRIKMMEEYKGAVLIYQSSACVSSYGLMIIFPLSNMTIYGFWYGSVCRGKFFSTAINSWDLGNDWAQLILWVILNFSVWWSDIHDFSIKILTPSRSLKLTYNNTLPVKYTAKCLLTVCWSLAIPETEMLIKRFYSFFRHFTPLSLSWIPGLENKWNDISFQPKIMVHFLSRLK